MPCICPPIQDLLKQGYFGLLQVQFKRLTCLQNIHKLRNVIFYAKDGTLCLALADPLPGCPRELPSAVMPVTVPGLALVFPVASLTTL